MALADDRHQKKIKLSSKKYLIISIFIILAVGLAVGGWFLLGQNNNKKIVVTDIKTQEQRPKTEQIYISAIESSSEGKYDEAQSSLDQLVSGAKTVDEQLYAWFTKSSLALNNERYADAYSFALRADSVKPTFSSKKLMADSKIGLNEKESAMVYIKEALSLITGDTEADDSNRLELQGMMEGLN